MGLMPAGASNPFSSVDQQTAFGTFKGTGLRDPDVLYAHKETMLAPYKNLKRLALFGIVDGKFLIRHIRYAILIIFVIAAIICPTAGESLKPWPENPTAT